MYEHYDQHDTPDLLEAVRAVTPDQYSRMMASDAVRMEIVKSLEGLGLSGEPASYESVEKGISDASWLIESGNADDNLEYHPFTDEDDLREYLGGEYPTVSVDFPSDNPITLAWNRIDGAYAFDSWLGRGTKGTGSVDGAVDSKHKIYDFASRPTQLPEIDATVILTDYGPKVMAQNSHRAAAAILRNENLNCGYLKVIDARTKNDR